MALHTGDQQAAHARDAVQAFDVDGADDGVQECGGNVLHQRHHGVAEYVVQGDIVLAHALGAGQLDVVLVALVHHIAAQPHGVERKVCKAHAAHRQHPIAPVGGIEQQAHAHGGGAVHLDIQKVHCRRHRLNEHDECRAQLIRPAALITAHDKAQRDAQHKAQQHGQHTHFDGNGQLLGKDLGHGSVELVNVAHAQITVQRIPPEMADLHRQRVQQAHGLQPGLDLCLGHFFVVCKVAFHRHEPQQAEHQRHNDEQGQNGASDAFCEILHHSRAPLFSLLIQISIE